MSIGNKVSVLELLATESLGNFKVIGGWPGKHNPIVEITSEVELETKQREKLVVLNCRQFSPNEIAAIVPKVLKKAAALFFIGKPEPDLPKSFAMVADEFQVPMIYLPQIFAIEDLRDTFNFANSLKETGFLLKHIQSSSCYLVNILNAKGMAGLIAYLEIILESSIIITNMIFEPVNTIDYEPNDLQQIRKLLNSLKKHYFDQQDAIEGTQKSRQGENVVKVALTLENKAAVGGCYLTKLTAANVDYGFLIILPNQNDLTEFHLAQLKKAVAPVTAELMKYHEVLATEKKYKYNFIYDLLHNNFESQSTIIKQGKIWGWDLAKPHQLMIIEVNKVKGPGSFRKDLLENVQVIINRVMSSFLKAAINMELNGQVVIMIPDASEQNRKQRKDYYKHMATVVKGKLVSQIPGAVVSIGIGRFYGATAELCRSYQEAKTALEIGKYIRQEECITHFEDLGMMRLLNNIRHEQLEDFFQEYLGELIAFDHANNTNLLETLKIYFKENCDFKITAKQMHIHANTLRYRLKKIAEILGVDLQKSEVFLNLLIALKILLLRENGLGGFE